MKHTRLSRDMSQLTLMDANKFFGQTIFGIFNKEAVMSRVPDAVYHGYEIFTVLLPLGDGRWSATSEIEIDGADGIDISQGFGGPCEGQTSEEARALVLVDTKKKIDDLLAEP